MFMVMLQVDNRTPFRPGLFLFPDPNGVETIYLALKATFALVKGQVQVAEQQTPIGKTDEFWGPPGKSSIRYAGEAHLCKPATDVVVVGAAYAPNGRPAPYFGVSISVGRLKKVLHVFGDRTWTSAVLAMVPSSPVPAVSIPLVWERSYGGQHDVGNGVVVSEPRNPVGCGFKGKRSAREMAGLPVPNLEDPRHPIQELGTCPGPSGVGFVAPSWQPRAALAGTYDDAWQRTRAPFLPTDFDPRFLQEAPADQIYPGRIQGGEPVELLNLSPAGPQRFRLPHCEFETTVLLGGETVRPRLELETLLLEPDQDHFSMVWRGAVPCGKRALRTRLAVFELKTVAGVVS
jgi:hypothetical protein